SLDRQYVRGLGAEGRAVADVGPSGPGAGDAGRGGVFRLVRVPSRRARGEQEVDVAPFERGRGFPVGVVPEVAHERADVQEVRGEPVDVQVVVLVGGRDHVAGAVVVVEGDISRHVLAERAEAAVVGVVAVHGRGGGDGGAGLVVVRAVLLVHPHDEPAGGGVVDDLRALDVGDVELGVGR